MSLRTPVTLAQPAVLPGLARRRGLRLALGLGAAALGGGTAQPTVQAAVRRLHWDQRVLQGFGTRLWLQAGHHDPQALQRALDKTVLRLRDIESAMSLFQADSALNRLNRQGYLDRPPADLLAVLRLARQVSAASHGAFDVSMQPLWQVWPQRCTQLCSTSGLTPPEPVGSLAGRRWRSRRDACAFSVPAWPSA